MSDEEQKNTIADFVRWLTVEDFKLLTRVGMTTVEEAVQRLLVLEAFGRWRKQLPKRDDAGLEK